MLEIWKQFIKSQYKYWFQEEKIETEPEGIPEIKGEIKIGEVNQLLKSHCKNIFLSDPFFKTTSMEEAKRYSEESLIQTRSYMADVYDCDNFSYALNGYWSDSLKSFCFGIAWSKIHAFNVMIDNKKQIWIIEPQSNKWMKIESVKKNEKYYPLKLVLI